MMTSYPRVTAPLSFHPPAPGVATSNFNPRTFFPFMSPNIPDTATKNRRVLFNSRTSRPESHRGHSLVTSVTSGGRTNCYYDDVTVYVRSSPCGRTRQRFEMKGLL